MLVSASWYYPRNLSQSRISDCFDILIEFNQHNFQQTFCSPSDRNGIRKLIQVGAYRHKNIANKIGFNKKQHGRRMKLLILQVTGNMLYIYTMFNLQEHWWQKKRLPDPPFRKINISKCNESSAVIILRVLVSYARS